MDSDMTVRPFDPNDQIAHWQIGASKSRRAMVSEEVGGFRYRVEETDRRTCSAVVLETGVLQKTRDTAIEEALASQNHGEDIIRANQRQKVIARSYVRHVR